MANGPVLARGIGWEDIMIAYAPSRPEVQGLRLDEIGRRWRKDPVECAFDIIEAEQGKGYVILFQLDEADLRVALRHHVMIGSDGSSLATHGPLSEGKPHPRSYGTFPRVLGRYARDEGVLTLPAAVHKMTGMPAARLGLPDRGAIRVDAKADVVVFSPERVADPATYEDPHRYAQGISHVVVNGGVAIRTESTRSLRGRVLSPRRPEAEACESVGRNADSVTLGRSGIAPPESTGTSPASEQVAPGLLHLPWQPTRCERTVHDSRVTIDGNESD
jgi:N-acyl-D-amino-acid deacylase